MRQDENTAILSRSFGDVADEYNRLRSGPSSEALDWLLPRGCDGCPRDRCRHGHPHAPAGRTGRPSHRRRARRPHARRLGRCRSQGRAPRRPGRGDPRRLLLLRRRHRPIGLALGRRVTRHPRGGPGPASRRPALPRVDWPRPHRRLDAIAVGRRHHLQPRGEGRPGQSAEGQACRQRRRRWRQPVPRSRDQRSSDGPSR